MYQSSASSLYIAFLCLFIYLISINISLYLNYSLTDIIQGGDVLNKS